MGIRSGLVAALAVGALVFPTACGGGNGDDGDDTSGDGADGGGGDGGDGGDGGQTGDGGGGDDVDPQSIACPEMCENDVVCFPDDWDSVQECVDDCADEGRGESAECLAAQRGLNLCLAGLDCDDLDRFWQTLPGTAGDYPCRDEDVAVEDC